MVPATPKTTRAVARLVTRPRREAGRRQFRKALRRERRRGQAGYTELDQFDADLARRRKSPAAVRARDYFDAPGGQQATGPVASCEEALARFHDVLSAEIDASTPDTRPRQRAGKRDNA